MEYDHVVPVDGSKSSAAETSNRAICLLHEDQELCQPEHYFTVPAECSHYYYTSFEGYLPQGRRLESDGSGSDIETRWEPHSPSRFPLYHLSLHTTNATTSI
jgi:hypothetical protein